MNDKQTVIHHIREAFRDTHHPGDAFLQGSFDGCEPSEITAPFHGVTHWSDVDAQTLDENYSALSFFSEGAFRFFLPAFIIADLNGDLQAVDPLFHLTHGFSDTAVHMPGKARTHQKVMGKSAFVNPRRYGAMTSFDYARCRLSVFTKEEAAAIIAYLEFRRDIDRDGIETPDIEAALNSFWRERAANAPDYESIRRCVKKEEDYLNDL